MEWWTGCTKCGPECQHCYIPRSIRKHHRDPWKDIYITKTWDNPHKWQRELRDINEYKRMFTNSLSDFFDRRADNRKVPSEPMYLRTVARDAQGKPDFGWRAAAWEVIKNTPKCVYLVLTKRPHRIVECLPPDWGQGYPNVWLGTSVGCNQTLRRIDHLRRVPGASRSGAVHLVAEPLLEDIEPEDRPRRHRMGDLRRRIGRRRRIPLDARDEVDAQGFSRQAHHEARLGVGAPRQSQGAWAPVLVQANNRVEGRTGRAGVRTNHPRSPQSSQRRRMVERSRAETRIHW